MTIDDGEPRTMPGTFIAIGNTPSYGGSMPICPRSEADDGQLDRTHVVALGRARLVRLFRLLLAGRHLERPQATATRAARVSVDAPGLVAYADGEPLGRGASTISVLPGALKMLVPQR